MADEEKKTKRKPSLGCPRKKENKKKRIHDASAIDFLVEENPKKGLLTEINMADANEEKEEQIEKVIMASKGDDRQEINKSGTALTRDKLTLPTMYFSWEDLYHFCMMSAEPLREVLANKKLQILSVTQLIDRDYNRREDYVLVGVLYKITPHCQHDLKDKDSSGGGGTYGGNATYDRNKRVRRECNRMFADVGGGTALSTTFCYIANTAKEGRNLLTYLLQTESHIGIERVFVVLNPAVMKRSRVKDQMVTIECNAPLIPLSTNLNQLLPIHKMKKPATHSCDNFFCYQNQKIMIDHPEMITTNYVNR
jgi:hypothetical protein